MLTVGEARLLPVGTSAIVRGRLTTPAGLTDAGRGAFIEDGGAGLAVYLTAGNWPAVVPGDDLVVRGSIETRDGQLTLNIATSHDIEIDGYGPLPEPVLVTTGLVCEPFEGRLVTVEGLILGVPAATDEGIRTSVDDGTGPLTVLATIASGVSANEFQVNSRMRLIGILGQHDLSGSGTAGYRLIVRSIDDVVIVGASPTMAPPTATPTPTPTTSPTDAAQSIAAVRALAVGSEVHVRGVVTAAPGTVLNESTLAIQDESGGILVRLPSGSYSAITLGQMLEVRGALAAPYGNLELRPLADDITVLSSAALPEPRQITASQLGEATEGVLARLTVTISRMEASSTGSLTLFASDATGEARLFLDARLGLIRSDFAVGQTLAIVGVVGDRLGLYRLWPRDASDITLIADSPAATPTPAPPSTPAPGASADPSPVAIIAIADALRAQGQTVAVEGVVTTKPGLLDSDGGRVTLQDATAAVLIRLPSDASVRAGQQLRLTGTVGTYYGAPSISANDARVVGQGSAMPASVRLAPLAAGLEWRLATISGRVESVHRDGDAWRAEISLSGGNVPVSGLSRSGIPSTALVAGRTATVTGIVKRAYPTASDQRLAVVPRSGADIRLGPAIGSGDANGPSARPGDGTDPAAPPVKAGDPGAEATSTELADLADLAAHESEIVTVGGLITAVDGQVLTIEDDSGVSAVRLTGAATELVGLFGVGDLVNATGLVERTNGGALEIVVDDPAALERLPQLAGAPNAPLDSLLPTHLDSTKADALGPTTGSAGLPPAVVVGVLGLAAFVALVAFAGRRRVLVRWRRS